jgi:hypothetical protein
VVQQSGRLRAPPQAASSFESATSPPADSLLLHHERQPDSSWMGPTVPAARAALGRGPHSPAWLRWVRPRQPHSLPPLSHPPTGGGGGQGKIPEAAVDWEQGWSADGDFIGRLLGLRALGGTAGILGVRAQAMRRASGGGAVSHPIFRRKPNASHMCARITISHI